MIFFFILPYVKFLTCISQLNTIPFLPITLSISSLATLFSENLDIPKSFLKAPIFFHSQSLYINLVSQTSRLQLIEASPSRIRTGT